MNKRPSIPAPATRDDNPFAIGWQGRLVCDVTALLLAVPGWTDVLARARRMHLACMLEPWATWIEEGSKPVESRWARTARAPHRRIGPGDVIVWKRSGGRVYGASEVRDAQTFELASDREAERVHRQWAGLVRVDPERWPQGMRFATMIELGAFAPIGATVRCGKRDRAGWNVLQDPDRRNPHAPE